MVITYASNIGIDTNFNTFLKLLYYYSCEKNKVAYLITICRPKWNVEKHRPLKLDFL